MNFDYQKAYCVQAVPAFIALPDHAKAAHEKLRGLVGDLSQGRDLAIPLSDDIRACFESLTTEEIARMARVSYFVGHWHPAPMPRLWDNSKGESWKVANCADQILRERVKPPYPLEIHQGKLRVTFSSKDCWLWREFGLATDANVAAFHEFKKTHSFGETSLDASAAELAAQIGDLWGDVDTEPENEIYAEYLRRVTEAEAAKIPKQKAAIIAACDRAVEQATTERDGKLWLLGHGVSIENCIYYGHTGRFCFGWRSPLPPAVESALLDVLCEFPFDYDIKREVAA